MPAWIHDRAEHLLAKNPSMDKGQAFAIATQQAHKLGKTPKGYGTKQGKAEAKVKYDKPKKEYVKASNPGKLDSPKLKGEPEKKASIEDDRFFEKCAYLIVRDELTKLANQVNVGWWWENTGGPFLAKGGSPKELKKMMDEAGINPKVQERFMKAAKERYADVRNSNERAARAAAGRSSPMDYASSVSSRPAAAKRWAVAQGLGGLGAAGTMAYALGADPKADPMEGPSRMEGMLGQTAGGALSWAPTGHLIGRVISGSRGAGVGAGLGAIGGGLMGHHSFESQERDIESRAKRALKSESSAKDLEREAGTSVAGRLRKHLPGAMVHGALDAYFDPYWAASSMGATMGGSALSHVGKRYADTQAFKRLKELQAAQAEEEPQQKAAASVFNLGALLSDIVKQADILPGGRADNRPDSDFDAKALAEGMKIESEHTKDKKLQKEISKDHLTESGNYYRDLKKMEKEEEAEKKSSATGSEYSLLDQVGRSKLKKRGSEAPNPAYRVKQAMIPSAGQGPGSGLPSSGAGEAAKKLQESQAIGVPKMETPKVKPLNIKVANGDMLEYFQKHPEKLKEKREREKKAFAVSQYSGDLGPGKFEHYAGYLPPFRKPQLKQAGPSNEELARAQKELNKQDKGWTPLSKVSAMRDELAKLNAAEEPKKEHTGARSIRRGAVLGGTGLVGGELARAGSRASDYVPSAADKALFEKLKGTSPTPVVSANEVYGHVPEFLKKVIGEEASQVAEGALTNAIRDDLAGNAAFIRKGSVDKKSVIALGEELANRPEILAHEMGHSSIHRNPVGRVVQNPITSIAGRLGASAVLGGSIGAITGTSENKRVQQLGRWAPALAAAPRLAFEAGATGLGLAKMYRSGANRGQMWRGVKALAPAWGTYAAPVAVATGAAHLGQGLVRRSEEEAQERKERAAAKSKLSSVQSPESQITKSQKVGAPKASAPPGPSIQQIAKPIGYGRPLPGATKQAEAEKTALLERLVRLGATPIKGTPKLFMKLRTPQELAQLQHSLEVGYAKRITDPIMRVAKKGLDKLPEGKLRSAATKGAKLIAEDPIGMTLSNMVPVPGANPAYLALKKGGEKLIDRFAPPVA